MKKFLIFLLITSALALCGLAFGPKSGEKPGYHMSIRPVPRNTAPKLYSKEILRNDLEEIKSILVTNHPAPYQFTGKEAFEKSYQAQLNKINRPMNLGEYFLIAAPLVESLHCGHTWISMPDEFWVSLDSVFFPMGLLFSGDKAYASLSGSGNLIPRGSEIITINKVPVSAIIESTKRLVNSDAKSKTAKLAAFGYAFPDLFALQYGNADRYEVSFIPPASGQVHLQVLKPVSRKTAWEYPINTLAGSFAGDRDLQLEIVKAHGLAVLGLGSFSYYNKKEKFYAFIDSAFDLIHSSSIQNLILDLRNNSGGDPYCAVRLLSYLETRPAPYFARNYEGYETMAQPIPVSGKNAFSGNLYVLINGGCFSTTGHLCALLKYSRRGKFVGEETGGTYECNDDHIRITATISKLNLNVARMTYTVAVKGISRETGIVPDYAVEPTIDDVLAGRDAVKNFVFNLAVKSR